MIPGKEKEKKPYLITLSSSSQWREETEISKKTINILQSKLMLVSLKILHATSYKREINIAKYVFHFQWLNFPYRMPTVRETVQELTVLNRKTLYISINTINQDKVCFSTMHTLTSSLLELENKIGCKIPPQAVKPQLPILRHFD